MTRSITRRALCLSLLAISAAHAQTGRRLVPHAQSRPAHCRHAAAGRRPSARSRPGRHLPRRSCIGLDYRWKRGPGPASDRPRQPRSRQRQDRQRRRHHQLLQRRTRLEPRLPDPRLHLDLHQQGRKARPAADLPLLPRRRHRQTAHPPHRHLPAGRLVARRQIPRLPLRRKRQPQRRCPRRHEALVRRHRRGWGRGATCLRGRLLHW